MTVLERIQVSAARAGSAVDDGDGEREDNKVTVCMLFQSLFSKALLPVTSVCRRRVLADTARVARAGADQNEFGDRRLARGQAD